MENILELYAKNVLDGFPPPHALVYRMDGNTKTTTPFLYRQRFPQMGNSSCNWRAKNFFRRKSGLESPPDGWPFNPENVGPLSECMGFSVELDAPKAVALLFLSAIHGLFLRRGPSAVSRLVISVVVRPAVKAMEMRRAFSHVGEEILKRVKPAFAYLYAAASVILEGPVRGTCASGLHRIPTMKSGRPSIGGVSVSRIRLDTISDRLLHAASAAYSNASSDIAAINRLDRSAFTSKNPFLRVIRIAFNSCKTIESLISDIYKPSHKTIIHRRPA